MSAGTSLQGAGGTPARADTRLATLADLDLIAPLFNAYRQFYDQPADLDLARRYLNDRMGSGESAVLLALDAAGQAIGFCQLYPTFCSVEARPIYSLYDLFVVPVVKDSKQQRDTINTVRALGALGVPAQKIRVLINKVEIADNIADDFAAIFGLGHNGEARVSEHATVFENEIFHLLKAHQITLDALNADTTNYRQRLRDATTEDDRDLAIEMMAMKQLAVTCTRNLDAVFAAIVAD